jgi:hypothetical protein
MKALVGLLAACAVFFAAARSAPAQVIFSFGSRYCAPMAKSELIVPGPHGSFALPQTVSELKRVLRPSSW